LPRAPDRVASTPLRRRRRSTRFGLRPGTGEARCRDVRVCVATCGATTCRTDASADVRDARSPTPRASGSAALRVRPRRDGDSARTPSGVLAGTGSAADRFEQQVALPCKYASSSSRSGNRRLAAAVILWSGTQGHGRSSVQRACTANGQSEDRKTSKSTSVKPAEERQRGRAQPIRLYGLQTVSP
jgi:hypothetical protein